MDAGVELGDGTSGRRRYRTTEEKRRIVEQTLSSGLSVASVAREHGVNANQVFYWRKLYRGGQLESKRRFLATLYLA
jgi:transposase